MAVDPVLVKEFGEGVVEGLERAPAAVQESEAPGQHVAPRGHAGEAPDVVALEWAVRVASLSKFGVGMRDRRRDRGCAG